MKKLIGLSVLVVLGFALVSGCAATKGKAEKGETVGEYIDDAMIITEINMAIVNDPDAHYFKIDVTTIQGDVVLRGFVNNQNTETRLIKKIKVIGGVKSVKSFLRIEEKK